MTDKPESTQQEQLEKEFPPELVKDVQGFDYIAVGDVIRRMNDVLGTGGWSSHVVSAEMVNNEVVAHVSVTAEIDGRTTQRSGFGGAAKNPRGMGDTYKAATSDALKKACQALGVGLHLAVDDLPDTRESALDLDDFNNVSNAVAALDEDAKAQVREWWAAYGSGAYDFYEIDAETWEEYKVFCRTLFSKPAEQMAPEDVASQLDGEVVDA